VVEEEERRVRRKIEGEVGWGDATGGKEVAFASSKYPH